MADFATHAEQQIACGIERETYQRIDDEIENLRAAMAWSRVNDGGVVAARIISTLVGYWHTRGYLAERHWVEDLLLSDAATTLPPDLRWRTLQAVGFLASQHTSIANATMARALFVRSLQVAETLGDLSGQARVLARLAMMARYPGNHAYVRTLLERSRALALRAEDQVVLTLADQQLGHCELEAGNYAEADTWFAAAAQIELVAGRSIRVLRNLPCRADAAVLRSDLTVAAQQYADAEQYAVAYQDREVLSEVYVGQSSLALLTGDVAQAASRADEALAICAATGIHMFAFLARRNLGYIALKHADRSEAVAQFARGLELSAAYYNLTGVAQCGHGLAAATDDPARAAQVAAIADALQQHFGVRREPYHEQFVARLISALGRVAWQQASAAGAALVAVCAPQVAFASTVELIAAVDLAHISAAMRAP